MNPGSSTESYPAFARIGLRENPGKNLNQVTCPDRDSNPGHLVSRPDPLTVTPQKYIVTICGISQNIIPKLITEWKYAKYIVFKVAALMDALLAHLLAPVLPTVMVVVHTELALFTVQDGKPSVVSSVANTHGQKETKSQKKSETTQEAVERSDGHVTGFSEPNTYYCNNDDQYECGTRKLLKDIPPELRRLAVASFRLNTEHDILGKHLNRLGILPSASCILCHQQEDMDRQHLAKCPALKSSKEVDRYWEARARMFLIT
ncbi:hypothetical protein ANN_06213 [Periplaneta americana]|uniref:Reverse transcriptase zinc-binding domain-containing protein n=1 Tax=Periplaneta americana TaxID=6978 RepID=A0ABQ8TEJ0_PERAM|nr:hypothetical protein ANN_06213 [Periplaneta americana]